MVMASSGKIKFPDDVNIELGNPTSTKLRFDDAAVLTLTGKSAGNVKLPDDFYGKGSPADFFKALGTPNTKTAKASNGGFILYYSTSNTNARLDVDSLYVSSLDFINSSSDSMTLAIKSTDGQTLSVNNRYYPNSVTLNVYNQLIGAGVTMSLARTSGVTGTQINYYRSLTSAEGDTLAAAFNIQGQAIAASCTYSNFLRF
jgi:hypothetical protein